MTLRLTTTPYDDANRRVKTVADLATGGDQELGSVVDYDQQGRVRLTRQLEVPPGTVLADDTIGIKVQTRYGYGTGGRTTLVTTYDGPSAPGYANTSTSFLWRADK